MLCRMEERQSMKSKVMYTCEICGFTNEEKRLVEACEQRHVVDMMITDKKYRQTMKLPEEITLKISPSGETVRYQLVRN